MLGKKSMKKIATQLWLAALVFAAGTLTTVQASASHVDTFDKAFGPEVPLALDTALPFPWKEMDGFWKVKGPDDRMFVMKSYKTTLGDRVLKVLEVDPLTGRELARGLAVPVDQSQVVRAQMVGTDVNYELFMGSYPDLNAPAKKPRKTVVFAVKTLAFDGVRSLKMPAKKVGCLSY
jgi:hypothetical protein